MIERKTKRKVIQITAIAPAEQTPMHLFALCDDGAMFMLTAADYRFNTPAVPWQRISDIPQDDAPCPS